MSDLVQQTEHPDELELELCRTGESDERTAEHVRGCATCLERVRELESLATTLAAAPPALLVPTGVRERIDAAAAEAVERARRSRGRRAVAWLAPVAASLLLGLVLVPGIVKLQKRLELAGPVAGDLRSDVNGDGRLDILDAFVLARRVETESGLDTALDFTGDGRVDGRDVDWLARSSVALREVVR